jgi:hypothetical protein
LPNLSRRLALAAHALERRVLEAVQPLQSSAFGGRWAAPSIKCLRPQPRRRAPPPVPVSGGRC